MSEPITKQRPTMDLDNLERRLRQSTHPHTHEDDPLVELARLVGEHHDPYGDVFAQEARPRQPLFEPPVYEPAAPGNGARREPASEAGRMSSRPLGDFAAIEAGLRGAGSPLSSFSRDDAFPGHTHPASAVSHDPDHAGAAYGEQDGYQPHDAFQVEPEAAWGRPDAVAAARSKRPVYIMAATIAVAVIGIGGAFALKGPSSSPGQIKTIMAAAGPIKVQPPADASATDQAKDDASATSQAPQTATKLVSREEQPVDLTQAVQDNVARNPEPATSGGDASSVPVPLSPGQAQAEASQGDGLSGFGSGLPVPKKVKVVSVRPDGTILPNDEPPAAAMPAPRQIPGKTSDRSGPVAKASTPKTATPKTTSRVAPTTIAAASTDSDAGPTDLTPRDAATKTTAKTIKKPKPQRVATADTGAAETQEATEAPEPKATGNGGFAVQLAAPGSEAEAKAASSKLGKKFADALSGHQLAFHKAESNGKSVYRVRVSSLSKEDAVSLCEKLKAGGGSCFVAKN